MLWSLKGEESLPVRLGVSLFAATFSDIANMVSTVWLVFSAQRHPRTRFAKDNGAVLVELPFKSLARVARIVVYLFPSKCPMSIWFVLCSEHIPIIRSWYLIIWDTKLSQPCLPVMPLSAGFEGQSETSLTYFCCLSTLCVPAVTEVTRWTQARGSKSGQGVNLLCS